MAKKKKTATKRKATKKKATRTANKQEPKSPNAAKPAAVKDANEEKRYLPDRRWWRVLIACAIVTAVALTALLGRMQNSLPWAVAWGCIVAVCAGNLVCMPVGYWMRRATDLSYLKNEPSAADFVGFTERFLIYFSCLLGFGQYAIAGWFIAKTVPQWKIWTEPNKGEVPGSERARYYFFLIGTALSMSIAVAAAILAMWSHDHSRAGVLFTLGGPTTQPAP